jgi:DNA repair ATPase RecN
MKYSAQRITDFKDKVKALGGERTALQKIISENIVKIGLIKDDVEKNDNAILLLQLVIENRQMSIIKLFDKTVASALKEVFGESYDFEISFDKRNNTTTADFTIHTGEYEGFIPIRGCQGKSIAEVVAVILRAIFIHLLDGRKVIILDECFTGIEYERQSLIGAFLRKVCEKFNIQIIMVSHCEPIYSCAETIQEIK